MYVGMYKQSARVVGVPATWPAGGKYTARRLVAEMEKLRGVGPRRLFSGHWPVPAAATAGPWTVAS